MRSTLHNPITRCVHVTEIAHVFARHVQRHPGQPQLLDA
jgi:hypothetical protein